MAAGETTMAPPELTGDPDVLWMGTFASGDWKTAQGISSEDNPAHLSLIDTSAYPMPTGKAARIEHEDTAGDNSASGYTAKAWFRDMGMGFTGQQGLSEVFFSYYIWFEAGFQFHDPGSGIHSGKLPGIAGNQANSLNYPGGGTCRAETAAAWSARTMWNENTSDTTRGRPTVYPYAGAAFESAGTGGTCSSSDFGTGYKTTTIQWARERLYYIVLHVKVNPTAGNKAGSIMRLYVRDVTANGDGLPTAMVFGTTSSPIVKDDNVMYQPSGVTAPANIYTMVSFPGGSLTPAGFHHYAMPVLSTSLLPSYALTSPGGGGGTATGRRGKRRV